MYSEPPLTLKRVYHEDPEENTTFDTTSSRVIAICILIILQHRMVNLGKHQYLNLTSHLMSLVLLISNNRFFSGSAEAEFLLVASPIIIETKLLPWSLEATISVIVGCDSGGGLSDVSWSISYTVGEYKKNATGH